MRYVLGVDEAGYGPNLGPLVITVTTWQILDDAPLTPAAWYTRLAPAVCRAPLPPGQWPLLIDDSKAVYSTARGLAELERTVLALWRTLGESPGQWRDFFERCCHSADRDWSKPPYQRGERPLPTAANEDHIAIAARDLKQAMQRGGIWCRGILSRAVFPAEFNRLVQRLGNKGAVLSHVTLELATQAIRLCGDSHITCICDKHGGRNNYRGLLQHFFPDDLLDPLREGRNESAYRLRNESETRTLEFCFRVGGEEMLPVAAASMASKYLRELSMLAFNDYWRQEVPGLAPTAGYPLDARRFWEATAARREALQIERHSIWRER